MQRPLQLEFYTYLPKQKRNTKGSSNLFNANISFEAYLHIPVYKDEEGHYFLTSLNKKENFLLYDN